MSDEPMTVENEESGCINQANGGINHLDSTPHASGNAANQAGSSFSVLPPATTFEEQLYKMENRGLVIDNSNFAIAKVRDLNYYRLRGYWLTLEDEGSFIMGTSFGDIWEIYQLDRELRRWLWQAIAPIEIKLRAQFVLNGRADRAFHDPDATPIEFNNAVRALTAFCRDMRAKYGSLFEYNG